MIEHALTIHFNRPVEQVFAFLVDPGKLSSWQANLVKIEQLSEGPLRIGSRFREVRRLGPRESEVQAEITAFEPNHRFETKTLTMPHVTVSYSFEREDDGTRLNYKIVMLTGGMMRFLEPMIAGSIRKESKSDFANLKRVLES